MYKPLQEIQFENKEELLFRICLGNKTLMPYIMENRKSNRKLLLWFKNHYIHSKFRPNKVFLQSI